MSWKARWIVAVVVFAIVFVIVGVVVVGMPRDRRAVTTGAASDSAPIVAAPTPAASAAVPAPKNDPKGREAARRKLVTPGQRLKGKPVALPETASADRDRDPRARFGDFAAEAVRLHLRPALAPCVAALLQRTPSASGKAIVVFDFVARRDVGAILDEVEVERGSGPTDALMEMCVRETLSGLVFEPPVPEGQGIFAFALDVR